MLTTSQPLENAQAETTNLIRTNSLHDQDINYQTINNLVDEETGEIGEDPIFVDPNFNSP